MTKNILFHSFVLTVGMLACGFFAIYLGKELCWDLANYHFYIAYAFFQHRESIDYWPTSYIHQFLNPTIDFLTYFLINTSTSYITVFLLGAIHGINLWLLFLIARIFLKNKIMLPLFLAFLGMYGPIVLSSIGSFQNDMLVSVFVLLSVYCTLKALPLHSNKLVFISSAGFILGLGVGLKLTAGLFAIGSVGAFLLIPLSLQQKLRMIGLFVLAMLIGMSLTAGYWMLMLWQKHGNPVFPFFNFYFCSPDFAPINWMDLRFMPKTIWESIFYPFFFSWDGRIAEIPFRDFRFLIVYVFLVIATMKYLYHRFFKKDNLASTDLTKSWFFSFFIFSYITWEIYFSIGRYFIPLELLSPLLIYLLIIYICKNYYARFILLYLSFYLIVVLLHVEPMVRAPWFSNNFFNVSLPQLVRSTEKGFVLTAFPAYVLDRDPRPQSYLIPYFPKRWRFIGIPITHDEYAASKTENQKIISLIQNNQDPIFLLTSDTSMPIFLQTVARFFNLRANGRCEKIFSDRQAITNENVLLCPVRFSVSKM